MLRRQLLKLFWSILALGLLASACTFFPGDPGPPIGVQGSGSDDLGAVLVLLCPGERVLSLTINQDNSGGSEIRPGRVLWKVEALEPSTQSEFLPGTEPPGFHTVVAPASAISGDVVVSVQTTSGTDVDGIRVRRLPVDVVRYQGRDLTKNAFYAKQNDVC